MRCKFLLVYLSCSGTKTNTATSDLLLIYVSWYERKRPFMVDIMRHDGAAVELFIYFSASRFFFFGESFLRIGGRVLNVSLEKTKRDEICFSDTTVIKSHHNIYPNSRNRFLFIPNSLISTLHRVSWLLCNVTLSLSLKSLLRYMISQNAHSIFSDIRQEIVVNWSLSCDRSTLSNLRFSFFKIHHTLKVRVAISETGVSD